MCLIIDTNRISDVLARSEHATPILDWLKKPGSHLAIGGTKLNEEYRRVEKFVKLLAMLDTAGRVRRFDAGKVDGEHDRIEASGYMVSDDPHVLGLAVVSGARILYSNDEALHSDFTNTNIIKPKGKVYQYKNHGHLLRRAGEC